MRTPTVVYTLVSLLFLLSGAAVCAAEPVITQLSGRTEIRDAASRQWRPARQGDRVTPGGAVRTRSGSQATVADDTASLVLKRDSQLQYEGAPDASGTPPARGASPQVYSLPSGTVDVTISPGSAFDLLTPLILTSVRGTRFTATVADDGSSRISVRKGSVAVSDKLGQSRTLGAGQSHSLTAMDYIRSLRATPRLAKEPPPEPALGRSGGDGGGGAGGGGASGGGGGGSDGGDD